MTEPPVSKAVEAVQERTRKVRNYFIIGVSVMVISVAGMNIFQTLQLRGISTDARNQAVEDQDVMSDNIIELNNAIEKLVAIFRQIIKETH